MTDTKFSYGMIGLGTMGCNLVLNMSDNGYSVAGYDKNIKQTENLNAQAGKRNVKAFNEIKAFVHGSYEGGFLVPFAKAGINYRTEGLSTLFLYTIGTEFRFDFVSLGAGLNGLMSIKDDDKTNQPQDREFITNQVNAGSKRYYQCSTTCTYSGSFIYCYRRSRN